VLDEDAVGVVLPELAERVHRRAERAVAQRRHRRGLRARVDPRPHRARVTVEEGLVERAIVERELGRGLQAEQLGAHHRDAGLADERERVVDVDATVPAAGARCSDAAGVDPALERGLADADGAGEVTGRESASHGL